MGTGPARRARGRNDDGVAPTCGQLLQRYRSLVGLTQEGLAEKAGYTADYIGKLERDQRELPAAALDRLAVVLGLGDQERAALAAARDKEAPGRLLVGRDAEVTEIRGHLAGLGPPVLLFAAEPGMGKTRLLDDAVSRAARSGWGIARGACQRRALDPYAPLTGALADALDRLADTDVPTCSGRPGTLTSCCPNSRPPPTAVRRGCGRAPHPSRPGATGYADGAVSHREARWWCSVLSCQLCR